MNRTRIAVAGLVLFTAACSSSVTGGDAKPGTTSQTQTSAPSSSSSNGALAGLKPCELVTGSEASGLGLGSPEPRRAAGADTCEWESNESGGLTVALNATIGAESLDYASSDKSPLKVGKYDGFTAKPKVDSGLCDVVISVSESSSVQVVASADVANRNPAKACELAQKSADFVVAKLP
ncbi:DUF3558 domain-containing protein [Lentzea californiensis]|uniref:DUF3558 domain-containing protein n=1 Tax=Lentzea californiensis TaxID=438851 RepID=UPI002164CA81|nr:DUF3558 domain-containing protein [Lentzea californiensis]MCR3746546.1 Protein of unknown function (DUF3558) [Lentzea californiensis]